MSSNGAVHVEKLKPDSLKLQTVTFAERGGLFSPLGQTGLNAQAGVIYEETAAELRGPAWYKTVREMLNTPVVQGMLYAVEMIARQAEWHLDPAEGDDVAEADASEIRDFVDGCRFDMRQTWEDTLASILSFLAYGFSVHEVVYKRRLGALGEPVSNHEDGRIGWDEWAPRSQSTLERWVFDESGHAISFMQRVPSTGLSVEIPLARCLHFRSADYHNSPEGRSILRAAYVDWDGIRKIQVLEAIGIERDLAGLPVALVPPEYLGADRTPDQIATFNAIKQIVVGVRNNDQAGVIFPKAYDESGKETFEFKLLSSGGGRQFDTSKVIERRTSQMTMAMLADFLTIGHGQTGSFALSKDKTQLFQLALNAWLDAIANVINDQAIKPLLRINGIDPRLTPVLRAAASDQATLADVSTFLGALMPLIDRLERGDQVSLIADLFDRADFPSPTETIEAAKNEEPEPEPDTPPSPEPVITPAVVAP